jgi:L-asparaginase II
LRTTPYVPVLELTRGTTVESIHYGAVAVANAKGELIASAGDPDGVAFLRSTAKPFQALPFIEAGGHTHFGFDLGEVALMTASHSGTAAHVAVAESMQRKVGITAAALQCGTHMPYHRETAEGMRARGETPGSNCHNCSGKHSGMLAFATLLGEPLESYLEPGHAVQQQILAAFADMMGIKPDEVKVGTDGCSAPNFAVPHRNAAWGLARLADPSGLGAARETALNTIYEAMTNHPELVGGPERFDTDLMTQMGGRLASKGGAEGYEGIAIRAGVVDDEALGVALKISDGDARKSATAAVALEVLRQLGVLGEDDLAALARYGPKGEVLNWRKLVVGESRPVFELVWQREVRKS